MGWQLKNVVLQWWRWSAHIQRIFRRDIGINLITQLMPFIKMNNKKFLTVQDGVSSCPPSWIRYVYFWKSRIRRGFMRAKKTKENKRQLWKRMCSLLVAFALIVMSGPQQAGGCSHRPGIQRAAWGIGDSIRWTERSLGFLSGLGTASCRTGILPACCG